MIKKLTLRQKLMEPFPLLEWIIVVSLYLSLILCPLSLGSVDIVWWITNYRDKIYQGSVGYSSHTFFLSKYSFFFIIFNKCFLQLSTKFVYVYFQQKSLFSKHIVYILNKNLLYSQQIPSTIVCLVDDKQQGGEKIYQRWAIQATEKMHFLCKRENTKDF